jgi:excisionase family DNA binding protein
MTDASPVLTVQEVAAYLKVHQSTIYRLLQRGEIPGFKVGSDWRFLAETINEWIQRQT